MHRNLLVLTHSFPARRSAERAGFDNIFDTSASGRSELVHTEDAGPAFANAVSCGDAVGRILYVGGGESCRSQVLDFYNRMFNAIGLRPVDPRVLRDRKSTRLNSSH